MPLRFSNGRQSTLQSTYLYSGAGQATEAFDGLTDVCVAYSIRSSLKAQLASTTITLGASGASPSWAAPGSRRGPRSPLPTGQDRLGPHHDLVVVRQGRGIVLVRAFPDDPALPRASSRTVVTRLQWALS